MTSTNRPPTDSDELAQSDFAVRPGDLPRLVTSPTPRPESVLSGDHWRITVLTDGLVRIEWSPDGGFEDRASTMAIHRDLPTPAYEVKETNDWLEVTTRRFVLRYDCRSFSPSGLSISIEARGISPFRRLWRYGQPSRDLGGTLRTLDGVDGRAPLGSGVVSRSGIAALDDSNSFLLDEDGWVAPRVEGRRDLYVFCYGSDHEEALRAFYALSGPQPLVPRFALGNWWSRWHPYRADEYLELIDRFAEAGIPFSVAVLDMDWHLVGTIELSQGGGWTGYSWNTELIPDPPAFLSGLHERGLRVSLNLHPADGVRAFEDPYPEMSRALGRDSSAGAPIRFDLSDPSFVSAYLSVLHRHLEDQGVDFWWIDWQSGTESGIPGVDPLWMLNHFHFLQSQRRRLPPLILSRFPGPGGHRYPVGFSGDTVISWASLAFQPECTATAANIGFGWWSHDIGGHFGGRRDDELFVRWVQLGVFSPIFRLHSNRNPFMRKDPFAYDPSVKKILEEALRLRHRLVPYLHTMNHRASKEGIPLVRPLYHLYPNEAAAYAEPNEYSFGSELLVLPVTTPTDPETLLASTRGWVPHGDWIDIFTGSVYRGPLNVQLHRPLERVPVLIRAGGILPLASVEDLRADRLPNSIEIVVAPGADGCFTLVEDDGRGGYGDQVTPIYTPMSWDQASGTLSIGPATVLPRPSAEAAGNEPPPATDRPLGDREGGAGIVPLTRTWVVTLLASPDIWEANVNGETRPTAHGSLPGSRTVTVSESPTDGIVRVTFGRDRIPRTPNTDRLVFEIIDRARYDYTRKKVAWEIFQSYRPDVTKLASLQALDLPDGLLRAITEVLSTVHDGINATGEQETDL